jgi:glycosyltransferase involved in cell wall biosynthesis
VEKIYKFNYIITCHNKEAHIELVLSSVIYVSSEDSRIYLVLDGCTDKTESIVDKLISKNIEREIIKLYADDVHELMAINVALNSIDLNEEALNVILQDDIVLMDYETEEKLARLYYNFNEKLGIVSFRHGANFSKFKLRWNNFYLYPMYNYIHTIFGHGDVYKKLKEGEFTARHIAIKSPICIPNSYIRELGICDENFSPWDDFEYCIRGIINGYINGVYGLNYYSHASWGTMRNLKQKTDHNKIVKNNILKLKLKYKNLSLVRLDDKIYCK